MPTYVYECDSCGHVWELFVTKILHVNIAPPCDRCQSGFTKPILSAPKIHFHHTEKEVRIPSKRTSVYIRKDD